MDNDLFLFPITGWEIKTAPVNGFLSVRFPFLSHEQQKLSEADPGRPYVMHAEQARGASPRAAGRAIESHHAYRKSGVRSGRILGGARWSVHLLMT